ncbi:MAG: class I SAM-dependent methyltransferase [Rhodocyclaceae bacterium]
MTRKFKTGYSNCAICGGCLDRELLAIREPDRFERHLGVARDGYLRRWVECSGCGAVTNVYPEGVIESLESLASGYYEVDFKSSTIGQKYAVVMSLPAERSDNAQRVERIQSFLSEWRSIEGGAKSRAIDIGAGTGVFLSRFLQAASRDGQVWSAVAVEPDPVAAEHLRGLGQFSVRQEVFSGKSGLTGFDLCTLNKVIEHLADPVWLLHEASSALDPQQGVLYVEVPAKETLFHRLSDDNILGALHRHLYDVVSLNAAISRAGLVVMRIERLYEPSGKISIAAFAVRPEAAEARSRRGAA